MPDSVIIYREPIEPFALACGGGYPLSLSVRRRDDGATVGDYVFDQPFVRIGRSVNSDLVLPDESVSFRHFYLQRLDGRWACLDLRATARARERNRSFQCLRWLDANQRLDVGSYVVHWLSAAGEVPAPEPNPAPNELAPLVSGYELTLVNRSRQFVRRIARPVSLVGSARQCDLWLKDPSVSRIHASLVLTPRGLWVVDLLGRHGVTVDGRRVRWKQLSDGSLLEIGRFSFRVHLETMTPPSFSEPEQTLVSAEPNSPESMGTISGSLSREFVMGVLHHLTESRIQFFEHLQFQSSLINELLAQLRQAREAPFQHEMARIEEINRELAELKRCLSGWSPMAQPDAVARIAAEPTPASNHESAAPAEVCRAKDETPATERGSNVPVARNLPEIEEPPRFVATVSDESFAPPAMYDAGPIGEGVELAHGATQAAHALLSQRMSRLARERNSRWRGLLRLLGLG